MCVCEGWAAVGGTGEWGPPPPPAMMACNNSLPLAVAAEHTAGQCSQEQPHGWQQGLHMQCCCSCEHCLQHAVLHCHGTPRWLLGAAPVAGIGLPPPYPDSSCAALACWPRLPHVAAPSHPPGRQAAAATAKRALSKPQLPGICNGGGGGTLPAAGARQQT